MAIYFFFHVNTAWFCQVIFKIEFIFYVLYYPNCPDKAKAISSSAIATFFFLFNKSTHSQNGTVSLNKQQKHLRFVFHAINVCETSCRPLPDYCLWQPWPTGQVSCEKLAIGYRLQAHGVSSGCSFVRQGNVLVSIGLEIECIWCECNARAWFHVGVYQLCDTFMNVYLYLWSIAFGIFVYVWAIDCGEWKDERTTKQTSWK